MKVESGEIEVREWATNGQSAIIIASNGVESTMVWLTADELANHARECLAIAESMRELNRGEETRQAGPEGSEEIPATRETDE